MGIVALFIASNMPQRIADLLLKKVSNVCWAVISLALLAGIISAFVDNVATLLIVAPVGIAISKRIGISPVPVLIAISVSSNLQGAATLVGDTTSIMLGGYAKLDFLDFFYHSGRPGIFWSVELGAAATIPVMYLLFKRFRQPVKAGRPAEVSDTFPTFLLFALVLLLISASFIENKPPITNGLICVGLCWIGILHDAFRGKGRAAIVRAAKGIDLVTIFLLAGLFVVVAGVREAGVIDYIGQFFLKLSGESVFLAYTLIVFASVFFSAFIDNIPYVATMLPVVQLMAQEMGLDPSLFYFGLLTGATLGGNFTPIGASANITAIGMLRKEGYEVKLKDFMRIGVPFSLAAVLVGYIFIWFIWR
jgi:Na+/H+ antiporter NhaD/arsenite permease-like protein